MSLEKFLNIKAKTKKEIKEQKDWERLKPYIKQMKEEWKKKHAKELDILKEIYELRKNTDIFKDNIDELKPKLIEQGNLLKQLKQCNPHFYGYFCALIEATKDKLDYKEINFEEMFLEVDEEIKEIKERQKQEKRKKAKKISDKKMNEEKDVDDLLEESIETQLKQLGFDELGFDDYQLEKVLEELGDKKLDEIKLQDAIEEKELMEQYILATGKNALTLKGTVRKDYLKWKNEQ